MARRTPPEENIPLIVFKPFVWRGAPPPKPPAKDVPVMTAAWESPPSPFDPRRPATDYDGHLVGDGHEYPPGTPLAQIRGVMPPSGHPTQKIIYVNGIKNSPDEHYDSLKAIAGNANAEVVGVYNASESFFKDALQTFGDKLGLGGIADWVFGHNPAVDTLRDTVYAELKSGSGEPINLMAHSQGAAITSQALSDVANRLHEDGLNTAQVKEQMSRINVDTFGGAAWSYPDGPHYNHYVNVADPVPLALGQGAGLQAVGMASSAGSVLGSGLTPTITSEGPQNPLAGAGAHTHWFAGYAGDADGAASKVHDFVKVYLSGWQSPFPRSSPQ